MALIKKDYGLIYNDDGSLCTTARNDDIPFQGVKSYAVEEATTNLITDLDPRNWNNDYATVELTNEKYMNMPVYKVTMPETSGPRIFFNIPYVTGDTLNGSVYIKPIQYSSVKKPYLFFREVGFGTVYEQILFPSNMNVWNRINVNHTFNSDGTVMFMLYTPMTTNDIPNIFYMAMPQVEKKPFATSFVDGSRPEGLLKALLNLDVNNTVINFWHKIESVYDFGTTGNRVISFSEDTTLKNRFLIKAEHLTNNATLKFYNSIDGTTTTDATTGSVDLSKWNMFTIIFDNGTVKAFLNGNLLTEYTVNLNSTALKYLFLPETGQNYHDTGLLSSFFFGKYKDKNGNVIWTDEYIQGLYEAKKPFNKNL